MPPVVALGKARKHLPGYEKKVRPLRDALEEGILGGPERRSPIRRYGREQAVANARVDSANFRTVNACSRVTPGNHSRNWSTVAPPSRFAKSAATGTRVPLKTHAPLTLPGTRSTAEHSVQSNMRHKLLRAHDEGKPAAPRLRTAAFGLRLLLPSILPKLPGGAGGLQLAAMAERSFSFLEFLTDHAAKVDAKAQSRKDAKRT